MSPTFTRCPVEVPIGGLDEPSVGEFAVRALCLGAEPIKRGQRATRGDFEDRAIAVGPTTRRCPEEIPVGGLDQPRDGAIAVRAVCLGTEAVKRRHRAPLGYFEARAPAVGPTIIRCPVEVPIGGLDEPSVGGSAVRAVCLGAEAV